MSASLTLLVKPNFNIYLWTIKVTRHLLQALRRASSAIVPWASRATTPVAIGLVALPWLYGVVFVLLMVVSFRM